MDSTFDDGSSCLNYAPQQLSHMPFKQVMDCLSASEIETAHELCRVHKFRPKLGQLLIASGRLSADDLDSMLSVREHAEMKSMPMGKLLVLAGLLSGEELVRYFELQKLLRFPSRQQDKWGQSLVARGVLTPDQLNTAITDRVGKNITLKEALSDRGWITQEVISEFELFEEEPLHS